VQIRKNDYLQKEKKTLNEMIDALARQCESMQHAGSRVLDSLTALEHGPNKESGGDNPDRQLLKQHRQHLEYLLGQIDYFRVNSEENGEQEANSSAE
jgi:hypothetical protein